VFYGPGAVSDVHRAYVIYGRGEWNGKRAERRKGITSGRAAPDANDAFGRGRGPEGDARIYIEIKFGRGAKSLSANLYLTVNHQVHTAAAAAASQRVKFRRRYIIIIIMVVFNIKRGCIFLPLTCAPESTSIIIIYVFVRVGVRGCVMMYIYIIFVLTMAKVHGARKLMHNVRSVFVRF